jgi:predicted ribosomally synthesized peptide with SipW-like signal peptide
MSRKRLKQYLLLLMAIGVIAVAMSGGGTFANFSAQVTNPNNAFVSGTLYLHDNGGTSTCTSESSSDNLSTNNCDTLFNNIDLTNAAGSTAHLTLSNAGSIPASDIQFQVGNCTVGTNGGTATFGTAPTCAQMYLTIQETQSDFSTNVYCAAGSASVACAAPSSALNLSSASTGSFANLKTVGGANATFTKAGGATDTRYYVIKVVPGGVTQDNSLQNRKISFDMSWHIDQ